jgi:plastocyanin
VKIFTVEGGDFFFNITSISVNKGDTVRIILRNVGTWTHNFGVKGYGVRSGTIVPVFSDTLEFIADKSGTFEINCSVGYHRGSGMRAELIVHD